MANPAATFADGTIGRWLEESLAVFSALLRRARRSLIGSSMGGWIALLLARELARTARCGRRRRSRAWC